MHNLATTLENNLLVSYEVKYTPIIRPSNCTHRYSFKRNDKTYVHKKTSIRRFIEVLFLTFPVKTWEINPGEWINKLGYIHMKNSSVTRSE